MGILERERYTSIQVTDFWHATEYLADASEVIFHGKKQQAERIDWLKQCCHELKNNTGAAERILTELKNNAQNKHPQNVKRPFTKPSPILAIKGFE